MNTYLFQSERLGFRAWQDADKIPFREMNSDPDVMEFFPEPLSAEQSDQMVERLKAYQQEHGFCFFAVDQLSDHSFIGFIGLVITTFDAFFTPCPEIGWRLRRSAWGKGYATEGAKRCLEYGFEHLQFDKICSFTAVSNTRSEKVMQKIGMVKEGTFDHPKLPDGHALQRHVLYMTSR